MEQVIYNEYFSDDVAIKYTQTQVIGAVEGNENLSNLTSKNGSENYAFTELTLNCIKDISFDNLSFAISCNNEVVIRISVWQGQNNIVEEASMLTKENKKIFFDGDGSFDLESGQSITIKITTETPIKISNLKITK